MKLSALTEKQRRTALIISALALSLVAILLRTLSLIFFYDSEIGYYTSGSALPIISNTVYALSVILFIVLAYFILKPTEAVAEPPKTVCYVSLLPALAVLANLFSRISEMSRISNELGKDIYTSILLRGAVYPGVRLTQMNAILLWVDIFLCALTAIFFLIPIIRKKASKLSVVFGIGTFLWLFVTWMRSYLDFNTPLNSPDKVFFHLGCIGAVLFVVAELRTLYGLSKPKLYWFSAIFAIFSLGVSAIPSIIGDAMGLFNLYTLRYGNIFFAALLVYAVVRVILLLHSEDEKDNP